MTHDYHDGLDGYSPEQILHDGCAECEARSKETAGGLAYLDKTNFVRAWKRAAEWNQHGLLDLAESEITLLQTLWIIQIKLESFGVPIGQVPA